MEKIISIAKNSPADRVGIRCGDYLLSINGHEIRDVLDYRFYMTEEHLSVKVHRDADILDFEIEKGQYDDLGLDFISYLMDEKRSCRNKCVFCFIDQLPKGMRDTLYFKDDDSRLSFLQGNYVTLTNMKDEELDRIIAMHITPVNVSVHTTNGALRVQMMKNRFADRILEQMHRLADGGVQMNCQIVLCKGLNDGEELLRSMRDLAAFYPAVESVSIVPAGLTCHREGLYPLETFTPEECGEIIDQVTAFGEECLAKYGLRIFYPADELYVEAGRALPTEDFYDGYPQLENGVGMMTSMEAELEEEFSDVFTKYDIAKKRHCSIATGAAAYEYIKRLVAKIEKVCYNTTVEVYRIENDFFGHNVTVAGLICGCDLINQLKDKELGEKLLLPLVMLRRDGDLFLDGTSLTSLTETLGVKVELSDNTGADLLRAILD